MLLLFTATVAEATCPEAPTRTALELATSLEDAESSYKNADVEGFLEAAGVMDAVLPCMAEAVPRSLVGRLHRTTGIRAFVGRNPDGATAAFAGSRTLEPAWSFPPDMVPPQHPMAKLYVAAQDDASAESIERPAIGQFLFDGRSGLERPMSRVSLLQHTDGDAVLGTWYLWPADPMPSYDIFVPEPDAPIKPARTKKSIGASTGLLIGAGALAVAAGGTYAAAGVSRGTYADAAIEHKSALRSRTNSLTLASAGIGAAALGVGATAVIVGKW